MRTGIRDVPDMVQVRPEMVVEISAGSSRNCGGGILRPTHVLRRAAL
ncbi:hypothetical protein ACFYZT_32190 [Streptomyces sp. NPDC001591]